MLQQALEMHLLRRNQAQRGEIDGHVADSRRQTQAGPEVVRFVVCFYGLDVHGRW